MAHIIVLDAGIGGLSTACELRAERISRHKISVVNASESFQFAPSNSGCWAYTG